MTDADPRVVAVVRDLFFVARIRETARLAGVPLVFARTPEEIAAALATPPRFVLLDLTAGFDYARVFEAIEAQDEDGARRAMRTHVENARKRIFEGG